MQFCRSPGILYQEGQEGPELARGFTLLVFGPMAQPPAVLGTQPRKEGEDLGEASDQDLLWEPQVTPILQSF